MTINNCLFMCRVKRLRFIPESVISRKKIIVKLKMQTTDCPISN